MPALELTLPQIATLEPDGTIAFNAAVVSTIATAPQSFMIFYLTKEDEQNGYGTVIQLDEQHAAAIYTDLNPEYTYLFYRDDQGQLQTLLWCIELATRNSDGLYVAQAKVHGRGVTQADMDRFNQIMASQQSSPTPAPSHELAETYSPGPATTGPSSPNPAVAPPAFATPPAPELSVQPSAAPAAAPLWQTPAPSAYIAPAPAAATPALSEPTAPQASPDLNLPPLPDLTQPAAPQAPTEASAQAATQPATLADLGLPSVPAVPAEPAAPQPNAEPAQEPISPPTLELPPLPQLPDRTQTPPPASEPVMQTGPVVTEPAAPQPVSFPSLPTLPTVPAAPRVTATVPTQTPASLPELELPPLPPLPTIPGTQPPTPADINPPSANTQPELEATTPAPEKNPVGRPPKPLLTDAAWRVDQTDFAWAKAVSRESIEPHKRELMDKLQAQIQRNQPDLLQNPAFQPALDQAFQAICQAYELAPTARQDLLKSLLNGRVVENLAQSLR